MHCTQCKLDHPADAGHFSGPALTTAKRAPRRYHQWVVHVIAYSENWYPLCRICGAKRLSSRSKWRLNGKPAPWCSSP